MEKQEITVERWANEVSKLAFQNAKEIFQHVNEHGATMRPWEEVDGALIAGVHEKRDKDGNTFVEIKTHDKTKNLEILGRYLGVFSENINVRGAVPIVLLDEKGRPLQNLGLGDETDNDSDA